MKPTRILIPVDGSDFSKQIIPTVLELFQPADTTLIFLRVAQAAPVPPSTMHSMVTHDDPYSEQWNQQLAGREWDAYVDAVDRELKNVARPLIAQGYRVHTVVEAGDPVDRITEYIRNSPVDLLAMATHGRVGLSQRILGSVAQAVLRQVSTPVLLKRPDRDGK